MKHTSVLRKDIMGVLSLVAGTVSLACGLLVFLGYSNMIIGVAIGGFSFGKRTSLLCKVGMALTLMGIVFTIVGLFR